MKFKDAFSLIYGIHDQCGERDAWSNAQDRLAGDVKRYDSYDEWKKRMFTRSDISDDERWSFDEIDASVEVLFALMYPIPNQERESEK